MVIGYSMGFGFDSFGSYNNLFCQKKPQEKGLVKKEITKTVLNYIGLFFICYKI